MSQIAWTRLSAQDTQSAGTGNAVLTPPSATTVGNVLIADFYTLTATGVNTGPAGWTLVKEVGFGNAGGTAACISTFVYVSQGESTFTFTTTAGISTQAYLHEFTGGSIQLDGTPVSASSGASNVSTLGTGSMTINNPNSLVWVVGGTAVSGAQPFSYTNATGLGSESRFISGQWLPGTSGAKSDTLTATVAKTLGIQMMAFHPNHTNAFSGFME